MCVLCAQMFNEIPWSERQLKPERISRGTGEAARRRDRHVRIRLIGAALVLNTAQHTVHAPEHLGAWPDEACDPYLVFITRGIDPARIARSLETFQHAGARNTLRVIRMEPDRGGRA